MPVPTEMRVCIGDLIVIEVRIDTQRGASIPSLSVSGYQEGRRCPVAKAYLDSGAGRWDVVLPSGTARRANYPVGDIEAPKNDAEYWQAVRRCVDLFAVDVIKDTAAAAGILT